MPRGDPDNPRHKQIEQIAKALKWDRAESFFANMVEDDDDEAEMNRQLGGNFSFAVLAQMCDQMRNQLDGLEKVSQAAGASSSEKN